MQKVSVSNVIIYPHHGHKLMRNVLLIFFTMQRKLFFLRKSVVNPKLRMLRKFAKMCKLSHFRYSPMRQHVRCDFRLARICFFKRIYLLLTNVYRYGTHSLFSLQLGRGGGEQDSGRASHAELTVTDKHCRFQLTEVHTSTNANSLRNLSASCKLILIAPSVPNQIFCSE